MTNPAIEFVHRGQVVSLRNVPPSRTLLELLREDLQLSATKEGCGEGDCGACTVVLGQARDGRIHYQAVNACIRLAHSIHGMALWTARDLVAEDGSLHPVQQALVQCHGSQCGFCTPGFVMSLFGLYQNQVCQGQPVTREAAQQALSGNLCRCTGYQPILQAAQTMAELAPVRQDESRLLQQLARIGQRQSDPEPGSSYLAPRTLAQLLALRAQHPKAQIVAGCTDVGLWVTKFLRDISPAETLEQAADQQYAQLLAKARAQGVLAPADNPQLQRLHAIARRLIPQTYRWNERARNWRWQVNLIFSKQLNAFCMPGGKIAVYSGIIDQLALTDDELAMILGHEMAHALREHARERVAKSKATSMGLSLGAQLLGLGSLGDVAAGLGTQLLTLKFSRDDETEADLVGLEIAARAGYQPQAAVRLWEKMMAATGSGKGTEFFSTHPSGPHRIQELQANVAKVRAQLLARGYPEAAPMTLDAGPRSVDVHDLVHAGLWGLMQAIEAEVGGAAEALEAAGIQPVETDLGEYILQISGQPPSHIVGPVVHMSQDEISDLFAKHHGSPRLDGQGRTLPTYDEAVVKGYAQAFSGWSYGALDNTRDAPLNAAVKAETGTFRVWRAVDIARVIKKKAGVPIFAVDTFKGYYNKANIRMRDVRDAMGLAY